MTYKAMGDSAKATEQLTKALQLSPAQGELKQKIEAAQQGGKT